MTLRFCCRTEEHTAALGRKLGSLVYPGDWILLHGELGAGKTVFAKGIAEGYGIGEPITSPSFGLMHVHATGPRTLVHVDAYRLASPHDLVGIGLADYLGSQAAIVVEWPDRLGGLSPAEHIDVHIAIEGDEGRLIAVTGFGAQAERLERLSEPC